MTMSKELLKTLLDAHREVILAQDTLTKNQQTFDLSVKRFDETIAAFEQHLEKLEG